MTQGTLYCSASKSFDGPSGTFLVVNVNAGKCLHKCQMAAGDEKRILLLSLGVGERLKREKASIESYGGL